MSRVVICWFVAHRREEIGIHLALSNESLHRGLFESEKEIDRHDRSDDDHKSSYQSLPKSLDNPGTAVSPDNSGHSDNQSGRPVNLTNSSKDDDSQRIESRCQNDLESVC
jgi:hypothetical protein